MNLLQRLEASRMPRPGENVQIYQHHRLLAAGVVVAVDAETVSIAGAKGLVDLDTAELRQGLNNGSITVKRHWNV
jgi:hypothetical protein